MCLDSRNHVCRNTHKQTHLLLTVSDNHIFFAFLKHFWSWQQYENTINILCILGFPLVITIFPLPSCALTLVEHVALSEIWGRHQLLFGFWSTFLHFCTGKCVLDTKNMDFGFMEILENFAPPKTVQPFPEQSLYCNLR